ncbi:MAG: hypothetical protein CFE32_15770, partial [Alphaproteobacteria bacterium PA3]
MLGGCTFRLRFIVRPEPVGWHDADTSVQHGQYTIHVVWPIISAIERNQIMPAAQALDADEILSGIRDWIQIESPTDDPDGMARMAARAQADYEAIGARVARIAGRDGFGDHLLAIDDRHCPANAAAGPGVLILSHIDTVHPIGTLAGPLPFRIEGDRAYGPGAEDMKGGTYLALAALRQIAREGLKTHLPVRHLMVSDEEMGS